MGNVVVFGGVVSGVTVCSGDSDQRNLRPQPTDVEEAMLWNGGSAMLWKGQLQCLQPMEIATRAPGKQNRDTGTGRD